MADGFVLTPELTALVQQVCKQYMTSFQPRPKRLRRIRPGVSDTSGSDALTLYYMILTTDVDPATGDQDEIISSAGLGQRYTTEPTEVDGEFKRTKNGDPIDVINFDTCQGYDAGTAVWVAQSDLLGYWEIISAACCTVDEGA